MKTPEQLATEFAEDWHQDCDYPEEILRHTKKATASVFLAGYQAAVQASVNTDTNSIDTSTKMNSLNNSNGWISVKERLPNIGDPCLVTCHEERYTIAEYDGIKWTTLNSIAYYHPIVTHWQWLPEIPKEEA